MASTTLYRFFSQDHRLLYVGVTGRAAVRWQQHAHLQPWWPEVAYVTVEHFPTHEAAIEAEGKALERDTSRYNLVESGRGIHLDPGRIREARLARGLSLGKLARVMGLGADLVYAWERGRSRPRPHDARVLAKTLGVTLSDLEAAEDR